MVFFDHLPLIFMEIFQLPVPYIISLFPELRSFFVHVSEFLFPIRLLLLLLKYFLLIPQVWLLQMRLILLHFMFPIISFSLQLHIQHISHISLIPPLLLEELFLFELVHAEIVESDFVPVVGLPRPHHPQSQCVLLVRIDISRQIWQTSHWIYRCSRSCKDLVTIPYDNRAIMPLPAVSSDVGGEWLSFFFDVWLAATESRRLQPTILLLISLSRGWLRARITHLLLFRTILVNQPRLIQNGISLIEHVLPGQLVILRYDPTDFLHFSTTSRKYIICLFWQRFAVSLLR